MISADKIRYVSDSISIVAASVGGAGEGFTNINNRFDVNADGFVSPIDSLLILNSLNTLGARKLSGNGEGEGPTYYYDVNGDGNISPIDSLLVLNKLNQRGLEGEGEGQVAASDVGYENLVDAALDDDLLNGLASDVIDQWRRKK